MPFLSPNQQCQSTEWKISHSMDLLTRSSPGIFQLCLWPLIAPGYLGEDCHQPSDASTPNYTSVVYKYFSSRFFSMGFHGKWPSNKCCFFLTSVPTCSFRDCGTARHAAWCTVTKLGWRRHVQDPTATVQYEVTIFAPCQPDIQNLSPCFLWFNENSELAKCWCIKEHLFSHCYMSVYVSRCLCTCVK